MKLLDMNSSGEKTIIRGKITTRNLGGHLDVRIIVIINKRELVRLSSLVRLGDKKYIGF